MTSEDRVVHQTVFGGIYISNYHVTWSGNNWSNPVGTVGIVGTLDDEVPKDERDHFGFITCKHIIDKNLPLPATTGTQIYSHINPLQFKPNTHEIADEMKKKVVGRVYNTGYYGNEVVDGVSYYIDAATVKIATDISRCTGWNFDIDYSGKYRDLDIQGKDVIAAISEVKESDLISAGGSPHAVPYPIYKSGGRTGMTMGRVFAVGDPANGIEILGGPDADHLGTFNFRNDQGVVGHNYVTIVSGSSGEDVWEDGDSGAAIINEHSEIIGLACAMSSAPIVLQKKKDGVVIDTYQGKVFIACQIKPVLKLLHLTPILHPEAFTSGGSHSAPQYCKVLENAAEEKPVRRNNTNLGFLFRLHDKLLTDPGGRLILQIIRHHELELNALMNRNRRVMIVWLRNNGPAFTAYFIDNAINPDFKVPPQIGNITVRGAIGAVMTAMKQNGSRELTSDINRYEAVIMQGLDQKPDSIEALLDTLIKLMQDQWQPQEL